MKKLVSILTIFTFAFIILATTTTPANAAASGTHVYVKSWYEDSGADACGYTGPISATVTLPESFDDTDSTIPITIDFTGVDSRIVPTTVIINGSSYNVSNGSTTLQLTVDQTYISGSTFTVSYGTLSWTGCTSGNTVFAPSDDTVTVVSQDSTPPLIDGATAVYLVNVDNPTTVDAFKATLTATDDQDGDVTSSITVTLDNYTGNEGTLGDYNVEFTATDSAGNSSSITVIFRVVDVTDPVINLVGSTSIFIEYGNTWSEPGYSCTDNYDPTCSVVVTGTVNNSILGTYTLYYDATDSTGNTAVQKTRTVVVQDTTPAVITLNGSSTVYIEFGSNYTEEGATWTDAYDGSGSATISGTVNVGVLGTYTLYYDYTDTNGNVSSTVTRTVVVRDTTAPTFSGSATINTNTGNPQTLNNILSTITANDLHDGDVTSSITVTLDNYTGNENTAGTYTVELSVQDATGNTATTTLTITVADNNTPVFSTSEVLYTLEYADNMTLQDIKDHFGV